MKVWRLIRTSFDSTENTIGGAIHTECIGVFIDSESGTAYAKIDAALKREMPTLYLAWDGKIYPRYRVDQEEAE